MNWTRIILSILRESQDGALLVQKLRKRAVAQVCVDSSIREEERLELKLVFQAKLEKLVAKGRVVTEDDMVHCSLA